METKKLTKIVEALKVKRVNFQGSDEKFARSIGINAAQYSRIMKGDFDKVLSYPKWISIARQLELNLKGSADWKTVETPVYQSITAQLKKCQSHCISGIICDDADIGKTYTAREYVKRNKNAIYIDCSQVKSKQQLVRQIAKEFGVDAASKYKDVYTELMFYISNAIDNPIIILDEVGDLKYDAFLELKAMWNATEGACAWYMMGADGLKEKMRRAIENKKVGYTEIFSRYGKRYQRVTPEAKEDKESFTKQQAAMIIKANAAPGTDVKTMLYKTDGSLRRIHTEISKAVA